MTWHAVHERKCKGTPEVHEKKQKVPTKPKDIHVISDAIGQLGEKSNNKHSYIPYVESPLYLKKISDWEELKKHKKELMDTENLVVPRYKEPEEAEKKGATKKASENDFHVDCSGMVADLDYDWGHTYLGLKTLDLEKQGIKSACSWNGETLNKAPPYSKPYKANNEKSAKEDNLYNGSQHVVKYGFVEDMQKITEKVVNKRPRYNKPKSTYQAANGYKYAGTRQTGHQRDGQTDVDALQPVSIRRKNANTCGDRLRRQRGGYTHPPDVVGINDVVNNAKHFQQISEQRKRGSKQSGLESDIDYESKEDKINNGIDFGNLLPRATSSYGRHRSNCALPCSGSHDDEERVLDKDLARSISMQPEKFRGKAHPSMPEDFEELAARIRALTKA